MQDTGPGMSEMFHDLQVEQEEQRVAKAELENVLPNLWNAIVEATKPAPAFWLGELLLSEITKETGYKGPQSR